MVITIILCVYSILVTWLLIILKRDLNYYYDWTYLLLEHSSDEMKFYLNNKIRDYTANDVRSSIRLKKKIMEQEEYEDNKYNR